VACAAAFATVSLAQNGFVNWGAPHTHPLEIGHSGTLLAVDTADDRPEVFARGRG
jgi:hypothetical protein